MQEGKYPLTHSLSSQALKERARKKKPKVSEIKAGSVIENVNQTRMLAETALSSEATHQTLAPPAKGPPTPLIEEDRNTNNTSNSQVRPATLLPFFLYAVLFTCISSRAGPTQEQMQPNYSSLEGLDYTMI